MSEKPRPAPLTFPDADRSPLSIRAKALVFFDPRSHRVREELERLAPQGQPVLIEGETGTGKELLARQIHRHSERAGLFVAVSCSALSRNHAEAELFGYAPGAHNGPVGSRAGWFGSANGGTLYLDEIADLPLTLQARLLQRWRNARCCGSARSSRFPMTCAWSPPPASTWTRRCAPASSWPACNNTCTTAA